MRFTYSGREEIEASCADVWTFVISPTKIAGCLPDVVTAEVKDERHLHAVVRLGVGPMKGNFSFDVALEPQAPNRTLVVRLRGAGMGSVVNLTATARLKENGDGATTLNWTGEAIVGGPVSTLAGRVLDAQVRDMVNHVFARIRESTSGTQGARNAALRCRT